MPVILQSRNDAATAYPGGPAMVAGPHGHLITVAGGDHGTFGRGNTPLDDAVLRYLRTGEVGSIGWIRRPCRDPGRRGSRPIQWQPTNTVGDRTLFDEMGSR